MRHHGTLTLLVLEGKAIAQKLALGFPDIQRSVLGFPAGAAAAAGMPRAPAAVSPLSPSHSSVGVQPPARSPSPSPAGVQPPAEAVESDAGQKQQLVQGLEARMQAFLAQRDVARLLEGVNTLRLPKKVCGLLLTGCGREVTARL